METQAVKTAEETLSDYRKTAYKISTYVLICFALRFISGFLIYGTAPLLRNIGTTAQYIGHFALSAVFLQILPSVIGYYFFRVKQNGGLKRLYFVPKRMNKAVANFPAAYGLAQIANLLTLFVIFILTNKSDLAKSVNTLNSVQPPDTASALFLMFVLVVIAPVFEEFMFRGLMLSALKPYGNGLSIFVTGILFGLFHGNVNQFFYTAILGIIFGYIANVTNSLLPTTVMHMIFNGIGGIMLLFYSTNSVQEFVLNGNTSDIPDGDMLLVAAYAIFMVCYLALVVIGVIAGIVKLTKAKRYKMKKVCPEISGGKKLAILLLSIPSIISVLLIADTFAGFSDRLIEGLFK